MQPQQPLDVSDDQFEAMVAKAIDALPEKYAAKLSNVAITYADMPTPQQRQQLSLRPWQGLYGLYEGVPQSVRGQSLNMALPDKITIFKHPMLGSVETLDDLQAQINKTLWHEVAHHFGLDHDQIDALGGS